MVSREMLSQVIRITTCLYQIGATDMQIADFFEVPLTTLIELGLEFPEFADVLNSRTEITLAYQVQEEQRKSKRREYRKLPQQRKRSNEYLKERLRNVPTVRLRNNFGSLLRHHLKQKNSGTFTAVGYTVEELTAHLQAQFVEGMTWDNYGAVWHIDHIKPASLFKYSSVEDLEFTACWSLNNLQPLFKLDNLKKGARYGSA